MFGIGPTEFVVIIVVLLICVNPKDLPKFFRRLGRIIRQLREANKILKDKMRDIDDEIKGEFK